MELRSGALNRYKKVTVNRTARLIQRLVEIALFSILTRVVLSLLLSVKDLKSQELVGDPFKIPYSKNKQRK